MKILPVTYSQNSLNKAVPIRYSRFETPQDTFTKTQIASSPSFGNGSSFMNLAKDVLNNSDLRQKYAQFTAEAFLALLGIAGGIELIKTKKSENNGEVYEFLEKIPTILTTEEEKSSVSQDDAELKNLRIENARLMKENDELKKRNASLLAENSVTNNDAHSDVPIVNTQTITVSSTKVSKHRCKHVKFPKKSGRLSKGQEKLKQVVQSLRLNNDECTKLTAICTKSLEKNTYIVDDRKADNSILALLLAKELEQNKKEPTAVIDKYYKLFGLNDSENQTHEESGNLEITKQDNVPSSDSNIENQTTDRVPNTIPNDKITVSAVTQIDTKRQNGDSLPTPTSVADPLGTCHVIMNEYDDPMSLHAGGKSVVSIDAKAGLYSYYDPKAYEQDEYTIFKNMQRRFEAAVYNEKKATQKVFWITGRGTAYKVSDKDVEKEIQSLIGSSACEYLTLDDTAEVADAINADDRFGKYFKLHAAIRLIDRFANFDDPDMSIENQCHEMLDSFINIVKRAFYNRINIKLYVDEKGNFGERIVISPSLYCEQDKKYFKDKPLIFGLGKIATLSPNDKQPVIVTVFNDD